MAQDKYSIAFETEILILNINYYLLLIFPSLLHRLSKKIHLVFKKRKITWF